VETALQAAGFSAAREDNAAELADIFEGMGDGLAEWTVTAPDGQQMMLQLAYFDRTAQPVTMDVGPVLSLEDVVGGKVCALAGRAEPRDYIDTAAALKRYSIDDAIGLARRLDPGLEDRDFADAARRLDRWGDATGPADGASCCEPLSCWLTLRDGRALVGRGSAHVVDDAVVGRGRVVAGAVQRSGHRVARHRDLHGSRGGVVLDVDQAVDLAAVKSDLVGVVLQGQGAVLVQLADGHRGGGSGEVRAGDIDEYAAVGRSRVRADAGYRRSGRRAGRLADDGLQREQARYDRHDRDDGAEQQS
jgi:hypothetical protein